MANIKTIGLFIIIIILSYLIIFEKQNTFIRFLLVIWLIGSTMHFFRENPPIEKDFDTSKMKLYLQEDEGTTEDMILTMKDDGYRPAELDETLAWLRANPSKLQGRTKLVALGSLQVIEKMGRVPIVDTYKEESPYLGYDILGQEWEMNCRFIGVKLI